ncbi:MAG: hypothetical protein Q9159_002114 [Coniocarpon cinnabarinum]
MSRFEAEVSFTHSLPSNLLGVYRDIWTREWLGKADVADHDSGRKMDKAANAAFWHHKKELNKKYRQQFGQRITPHSVTGKDLWGPPRNRIRGSTSALKLNTARPDPAVNIHPLKMSFEDLLVALLLNAVKRPHAHSDFAHYMLLGSGAFEQVQMALGYYTPWAHAIVEHVEKLHAFRSKHDIYMAVHSQRTSTSRAQLDLPAVFTISPKRMLDGFVIDVTLSASLSKLNSRDKAKLHVFSTGAFTGMQLTDSQGLAVLRARIAASEIKDGALKLLLRLRCQGKR